MNANAIVPIIFKLKLKLGEEEMKSHPAWLLKAIDVITRLSKSIANVKKKTDKHTYMYMYVICVCKIDSPSQKLWGKEKNIQSDWEPSPFLKSANKKKQNTE